MSVKRWVLVLILIVSVILTACGGDDDDKGGTKEFYDGGISFNLPGGWTTEADDLGQSGGRITLFSSKKIREAESADDLPNKAVFGAIMFGPIYDFELEDGPEGSLRSYLEVEGGLPDDAEFEDVEISGNPASRFTTTEEQNGLEAYSYNVSIFFDDTIGVYVLLYGFKGDESTFDSMFGDLANSLTVDAEKLTAQFDEQQ